MPTPRIPAVDKVSHEDGWLLFDWSSGESVAVPSEIYLREFRDTDPGDIHQLAQLCSLGLICGLTDAGYYLGDLPGGDGILSSVWPSVLGRTAAALDVSPATGNRTERRRSTGGFAVHVAEVAVRVESVQSCTAHILAYAAGEPVQQAWPNAKNDDEGWQQFIQTTDAALRDFHVHVSVDGGDMPGTLLYGGMPGTLYSVAMLQLVNDLTEHVPFLTCANETCGRLFARQRGRTEHGGNRMRGVMYCSNTCARAQYQREKRRRDRAARNGGQR